MRKGLTALALIAAPLLAAGASAAVPDAAVQLSPADLPVATTDDIAGVFTILAFTILLVAFSVYLTPLIIAFARGHVYRWPIAALTVLGGWTAVGWLAALVWSCWPRGGALNPPTGVMDRTDHLFGRSHDADLDRVERLAAMRDKGVLTQEEFDNKKVQILGLTAGPAE